METLAAIFSNSLSSQQRFGVFSVVDQRGFPYPNGQTDQLQKAKRRSYTLRFADLFVTNNVESNELNQNYLNIYNEMLTKMESNTFIMPAFWNCIHDLVKNNISFNIIFRTFGTDTREVTDTFNRFCNEFGYNGTQSNKPNLLLESSHIGAINCDDKNGKSLIIGTNARNPIDYEPKIKAMSLSEFKTLDRLQWYQNNKSVKKIIRSEQEIYEFIKSESLKQNTMLFSDDYYWWAHHGENSDGGKMMILDDNDANIEQIFFDDNISFDKSSIVDVRKLNVENGKKCVSELEWEQLKGKNLIKVEPLNVILDDHYFTKIILGTSSF